MIPRKRIDIGWADLASGVLACVTPGDEKHTAARVESAWHTVRGNLACLSVRSGVDALLNVLHLPVGSEVLVSAVTIRDIKHIIEAHGLIVVPVDVDPQTLGVSLASLERALSPRTRVLLIAHLFGSRMPMRDCVQFCDKNHLLLIEDCAQAYTGDGWRGDSASDVCLFSFGPIKTATALGGAVMTFRDGALRDRVQSHMAQWPVQLRRDYFLRLLKYALFVLLSYRPFYTLFAGLLKLVGVTPDQLLATAVSSFAGGDFFRKIRRRPSLPLLVVMQRRIAQGLQISVARRSERARQLVKLLPALDRPGMLAPWHSHWVFPVLNPRTDAFIAYLRRQGFDATCKASSMTVIAAQHEPARPAGKSPHAFKDLCYLPVHEGMSAGDIERLAAAVREFDAVAIDGSWRAA